MLLGVVCAAVGVLLTLRPFASLDVLVWFVAGAFFATGVSELLASRKAGLVGFGWIAAGVVLIMGLLVGPSTVIFGLGQLLAAGRA